MFNTDNDSRNRKDSIHRKVSASTTDLNEISYNNVWNVSLFGFEITAIFLSCTRYPPLPVTNGSGPRSLG